MKRSIPHILFLSASISLGLLSTAAVGGLILADGNSVVTINPGSTGVNGVNSWSVNGVSGTNQLKQQWFWYQIDGGPIASIDTLGTMSYSQPGVDAATVSYSGSNGLSVLVKYTLAGGSLLDGQSALGEIIKVTNNSGFSQAIHFFQYSNFVLEGNPGGDSLKFSTDSDSKVNAVRQTKGASRVETVVTPAVDHYQGGDIGIPSLLPLSNTPSAGSPLGPGKMMWDFQWDKTIPDGGTFLISQDNRLNINPGSFVSVPEPSTFALLLSTGLGLGYILRRCSLSFRESE